MSSTALGKSACDTWRAAGGLDTVGDRAPSGSLMCTLVRSVCRRAPAVGRAESALLAFAAQHRAKLLTDEGRLEEAHVEALRALSTRRAMGEADLIANSQQVVAVIESRRSEGLVH